MDQVTHKRWDDAIERLGKCPKDRRDHFAALIMCLADCYGDDHESKAVVLVDTGDALAMFSAGADEMAAAEMVGKAHEVFMASVTADAPPKELFN